MKHNHIPREQLRHYTSRFLKKISSSVVDSNECLEHYGYTQWQREVPFFGHHPESPLESTVAAVNPKWLQLQRSIATVMACGGYIFSGTVISCWPDCLYMVEIYIYIYFIYCVVMWCVVLLLSHAGVLPVYAGGFKWHVSLRCRGAVCSACVVLFYFSLFVPLVCVVMFVMQIHFLKL